MGGIIYKYRLDSSVVKLKLPIGAQVLTAQMQRNDIVIWALLHEDEMRTEQRCFTAVCTGDPFDPPGRLDYINTVSSTNGIVWHVFEVSFADQQPFSLMPPSDGREE